MRALYLLVSQPRVIPTRARYKIFRARLVSLLTLQLRIFNIQKKKPKIAPTSDLTSNFRYQSPTAIKNSQLGLCSNEHLAAVAFVRSSESAGQPSVDAASRETRGARRSILKRSPIALTFNDHIAHNADSQPVGSQARPVEVLRLLQGQGFREHV